MAGQLIFETGVEVGAVGGLYETGFSRLVRYENWCIMAGVAIV